MVDDDRAPTMPVLGDDAWHRHHAAAPHGGDADTIGSAQDRRTERRRRPTPNTPAGYLHELPARVLLDRMPTPMLAAGLDGILTYANPAFSRMLGHPDSTALIGRSLPTLLAGQSHTRPHDCVTALRAAPGTITDWCHAHGFPVRTVVSEPLLVRATDPILLLSITDITELLWSTPPRSARCQLNDD